MERRRFLRNAALAGAGVLGTAGLAACGNETQDGTAKAPAQTGKTFELKMVTTWPPNFPGLGTGAQRLANRIEEASGGSIKIRVYAAGELVPAFGAFDAVSGGTADMYHGAEYYWQGKSKAFNFFGGVPFGMTSTELAAWIRFGGGQELWDELSANYNIKPLNGGSTGTQMGGWFKKEITSLEDFKGLRMRIPGLGGEVIRRLGGSPQALPSTEVFLALQSGAIDATEWVGPWNDLAFGFYKIAKYYYYPGFHEPGTALGLGINLDVWNAMSATQQTIIKNAATAEYSDALAEFNTRNAEALDVLVNDHGVQLRRFPQPVIDRLAALSREVVAEAAEGDDITRRVHDSYMAFMKKQMAWAAVAENAYTEARAKALD